MVGLNRNGNNRVTGVYSPSLYLTVPQYERFYSTYGSQLFHKLNLSVNPHFSMEKEIDKRL